MAPPRLSSAQLGVAERVLAGVRWDMYRTSGIRLPETAEVAYARYDDEIRPGVDSSVLEYLAGFAESLPAETAAALRTHTAWPLRLIEDPAGGVTGFATAAVPAQFFLPASTGTPGYRVPAEIRQLLADPDLLTERGLAVTDQQRYRLLLATARTLAMLHQLGIAVGDMSSGSLLFGITTVVEVYFTDADAMRVHGHSVLAQVETPGWDVRSVNPGEELGTVASDSYKFGLLALRLLVGDPLTRDPELLAARVPRPIRDLVRATLSAEPSARPQPASWEPALLAAIAEVAQTVHGVVNQGHPAPPYPAPDTVRADQFFAAQRFPAHQSQPAHQIYPTPESHPAHRSLPEHGVFPAAYAPNGHTTGEHAAVTPATAARPSRSTARIAGYTAAAVLSALAVAGLVLILVLRQADPVQAGVSDPNGATTSSPSSDPGPPLATLIGKVGRSPWGVAVDPELTTALVTNADDNTVSIIDTRDRTVVGTLGTGKKPAAIAIDPSTHQAWVTQADDRSVAVIDVRTRTFLATIPVGAGPYGVAVDAKNRKVYVTNFDENTVSVIDPRTNTVVATIRVGGHPYGVAVDPSGRSVLVANAAENTVSVIDTRTQTVVVTMNVGQEPWGVAINEGGVAYVTNHGANTLSVIDTTRRSVTGTVTTGPGPVGVVFAADGRTAYITDHSSDTVSIVETGGNRVTATVHVGQGPHGVTVDRTSRAVYVTNMQPGTLSVLTR